MADTSPIAALIRNRRERPGGPLRRSISVRAAAKRAAQLSSGTFSEPTWRRIEAGTKIPNDREVVLMCAAINELAHGSVIGPDDLEEAGRLDAAELFRDWIRERTKTDPALQAVDPDLTPESLQHTLQGMLSEIRALPGVSAEERAQMEKVLLSHLDSTLKTYSAQLRILRPR